MKLLLAFASSAVVVTFIPVAFGAYIREPSGVVVSTSIVDNSPVSSVFFPVPTVVSSTVAEAAPTTGTFSSPNNITTVVLSSVAGASTSTAASSSSSVVFIGSSTTSLSGATTSTVTSSFVGASCPAISSSSVVSTTFAVPTTTAGITTITLPASNGTAVANTTSFAFPTTTANASNHTTGIVTVTISARNGTAISSSTVVITALSSTATSGPQSTGVANATSSFFEPCPTISGSRVSVSTTTSSVHPTSSVHFSTTTGIVSSTFEASNGTMVTGPQTTTIIPSSNITSSVAGSATAFAQVGAVNAGMKLSSGMDLKLLTGVIVFAGMMVL
ncbi:hypothetical protein EDD18DRAFT_665524 [Armillaria luteobubalina]|uniref:Uncharacterized protein n=1 Tax=Armillaria luteobubalina TaxID=153913 RepID=A0AA39PM16_9AGAR|nr:hypothetical protein EDD18DRAFT_665524 [Armillaria luteobubalina]